MYFGVVIEILLTKSNVTSTTMLENEQRKNSTTKTARLKQHGNGWAKFSQIDISKESLLGPLKYEGSLILMTQYSKVYYYVGTDFLTTIKELTVKTK